VYCDARGNDCQEIYLTGACLADAITSYHGAFCEIISGCEKGFSGHLENGCDTPFVPSDDNLWGLKSIMFYIYMLYVSVYLF